MQDYSEGRPDARTPAEALVKLPGGEEPEEREEAAE